MATTDTEAVNWQAKWPTGMQVREREHRSYNTLTVNRFSSVQFGLFQFRCMRWGGGFSKCQYLRKTYHFSGKSWQKDLFFRHRSFLCGERGGGGLVSSTHYQFSCMISYPLSSPLYCYIELFFMAQKCYEKRPPPHAKCEFCRADGEEIFGQKTTQKTEGNLSPITVFSRWYTKPLSSEFFAIFRLKDLKLHPHIEYLR